MIIAAVAVIPDGENFIGLQCPRGHIMPGGKYDEKVDKSFHHTAIREAYEETGLIVEQVRYVFNAPDCSGDFMCFAFWCPTYRGTLTDSREGKATSCSRQQLLASIYGPWYRCLFDVLREKGLIQ